MKKKILILPLLLIFLVLGCKNPLIQNNDINTTQYGSLTIGDTTRALKIEKIVGAKVSVSGVGFTDLSTETEIQNGKVSGVTIKQIPVGKNRIVTVQAASKSSKLTEADFINGVVMRAVTDINIGGNTVDVNWSSTALGNVFYELLNLDYDISTITTEEKASIAEAIPTDVHATLVNAKQIAEDFKSGTLQDKSAYALSGATVNFDVNGTNYDDYIVQVTDPASKKEIKVAERKVSGITAGTWDLVVWSNNGFEWYRESQIDVAEGAVIELGKLNFITPEPRFSPNNTYFVNSIEISIEAEPGSTIYYTTDGSDPTVESTEYTAPFSITADTTIKAFAVMEGLEASAVVTKEYKIANLGYNYPDNGAYSVVDKDSWKNSTFELGANIDSDGNGTFAVYSENATKILLEIYNKAYGEDAAYDYWMEKGSDNIWRAKISGIESGTLYAFRAWGPNWPYAEEWDRGNSSAGFISDYDSVGNRFNPNKVLFDPYAKEISHDKSNPTALGSENGGMYGTGAEDYNGVIRRNFDTGKYAPKAVVVDDSTSYGTKPKIPQEKAIIYEAHARGITKHPSSASLKSILNGIDGFENVVNIPAEYQGTYKGAAMLAPYLKALGVNTIELLPVHESDNDANPSDNPGGNYWAYMTYGYFAPDRRYSYDKSHGGPTKEFKEMVKAFHEAGMEVYLDVVFNHSGEGGTWGDADSAELTFMRGLDNSTYYSLTADKKGYWETTGCGNNLQCDNPTVRQLILDSLTYWIDKMGVDGYRFDLAPVIGREKVGNEWVYSKSAKTILDIIKLGEEKDAEMIAEAWDTQWPGGYQVGNFPDGWGEWNGRFRDAIRKFVGNGERGSLNNYIYGDYDNFNDQGGPQKSVNFVVAHDGFTLADLCSYGGAGNAQNGELTWPFGPSDGGNGDNNSLGFVDWTDEDTEKASKRQAARNYIAIQMMSRGVPMIVWGDEFCRTQNGNNNPYNIDSVATWSNYNMINTDSPHKVATGGDGEYHNNFGTFNNSDKVNGNFMFMKYMLNLKANEPALNQANYNVSYDFKKEDGKTGLGDGDRCVWLHIDGSSVSGGSDYLVFMNMYTDRVTYTIPKAASGKEWVRVVDTASWAEGDFNYWEATDLENKELSGTYGVNPWSVVILKEIDKRETVDDPVITILGASEPTYEFEESTTIEILTFTLGTEIYYTTDGSIPSKEKGTKYEEPFTIDRTTTVKAIAYKDGAYPSAVSSQTFTNTACVDTPVLSVLAGNFWNEITVFVSCDTEDATIYYTTDGTEPTAASTKYTASGIKISDTTTLKVIATKAGISPSIVTAEYTKQENPTYTENKSGVILQGFNWDSAPRGGGYTAENPNPAWGKWYTVMQKYADEIKDRFEYVWFPPASKTDSASSEGYAPTELNDLNSFYGTEKELEDTIKAISPAKAIADIVVNHRAGTSDWGDFTNPKWTDDYYSITSDDEFNTSNKGAADTGMGYAAYRDLDHTNTQVQQGIYSWMNSVLKRAGFVGWRYDYVKGFAGDYVGYYNAMTDAAFSVGEYWPDNGDWKDQIDKWITATGNEVNGVKGKQSRAFDFVLKQKMNEAFGWYKAGDKSTEKVGDLSLLADTTTLMRSNPSAAVTFVDNHDTGSTQQHWELNWNRVAVAYTYILTHPGMPCVASQHYFAEEGWQYRGGEKVSGTEYTMKEHIDYLIQLRHEIGIEYDDSVNTEGTTSTCYVGEIEGNSGTILIKIGDITAPTETGYDGKNPIYAGKNFAIWQKNVNGSDSIVKVLTFTRPDDWGDKVYAYFFDSDPVGAAWPGTEMEWIGQNEYGQHQFIIAVPTEAKYVIFNDGSKQTVNITLSPTEVGYYTTGTNGEKKYTVSGFNSTPTEPTPEPDSPDSSDPESSANIIYLKPNSNWKQDNARFAAYFFGNGEKWISMVAEGDNGVYKCEIPEGFPNVIFCRMIPSTIENNWNNKWNQTADLTIPTNGNNLYTVAEGSWDSGTWSTYIPSTN